MLLSPNQRLALFASKQYHKRVYSFNAWIEKLWQTLENPEQLVEDLDNSKNHSNDSNSNEIIAQYSSKSFPKLLTNVEQLSIFEEIIQQSPLEYPLLRREATAKLALEAWNLCWQWELINREGAFSTSLALTEDHFTYLKWSKAYHAKCVAENWIDTASLLNYVSEAIDNHLLQVPSCIICIGFTELTPAQEKFLKICESKGSQIEMRSLLNRKGAISPSTNHPVSKSNSVSINHFMLSNNSESRNTPIPNKGHPIDRSEIEVKKGVYRIELPTEEQELALALQNAKSFLIQNPETKIGIIVPDLEQKRLAVLRILKAIANDSEYNVAAPIPLIEYPIINAAFIGLNLMQSEIPFKEFSQLLRIAYLGGTPEEICLSAELEVQLRDRVNDRHSLSEYLFFLEGIIHSVPKLKESSLILKLKHCLALRPRFLEKQSTTAWKDLCVELLTCLGWPGTRDLNEEESALKEHWNTLLNDFCKMEQLLGEYPYIDCLKYLRRLALHTQFSLQSQQISTDAPIQVLGLLEGMGFPFDFLWVLGMHRDAWPKEPAPNPFIPVALQIKKGMPKSSAARELQVAERIIEELASGAETVIFSYPTLIKEQISSMTPLISKFQEITKGANIEFQLQQQRAQQSMEGLQQQPLPELARFEESAPPLQESEFALGGTKILALQAVCPFRAFAEIRLKATLLKKPRLGLKASERGEIIHRVLMIFWQSLKNQTALLALQEPERSEKIEQAIERVFKEFLPHTKSFSHSAFTKSYLSLEKNRILDLVKRFLMLEEKRPPFEVIAHEVSQEIVLGDIRLKLRIDRIDKLESGDELLIDYKTGLVQISEWFGERPLAPQLPLYCIARKTKTAAVAFAIVRPDEVRFRGLCAEKMVDKPSTNANAYTSPESSAMNTENHYLTIPGVDVPAKLMRYGAEQDWESQKTRWEHNLDSLAQEFKEGNAFVKPLKGEQSCRTCHLESLCRVRSSSV